MARNYFTDDQMEILKGSPYVKRVSKATVAFTEEFKAEFIRLYHQGTGPADIIRQLGIDPKILGRRRIRNLSDRIRKQYSRPEGFSRKPNRSKGRPRKMRHPEFDNDSQAVSYYKEYSRRLEQEIELLKK